MLCQLMRDEASIICSKTSDTCCLLQGNWLNMKNAYNGKFILLTK